MAEAGNAEDGSAEARNAEVGRAEVEPLNSSERKASERSANRAAQDLEACKDKPEALGVFKVSGRGCTDVWCLLLFILHYGGLGAVVMANFDKGRVASLYDPRDYRGDYCGLKENWNSDTDHSGHPVLIQLMNTTGAVKTLAEELVCSTAAEARLKVLLSASEFDAYMCACCKTCCAACQSVLDVEDHASQDAAGESVAGKLRDLTNPSRGKELFQPGGANAGSFNDIWANMVKFFNGACVTSCDVILDTGADWREYKYSPTTDVPWKKAWDALVNDGGPIGAVIEEKFVFKAMPKRLCNYDPKFCVPFPGVKFDAFQNWCIMKVDSEVAAAMGDFADGIGLANAAQAGSVSFGTALGDIIETLDTFCVVATVSFVIAFTYLVLLRFFVRCVVWIALFATFVALLFASMASYVRSIQCSDTSFYDTTQAVSGDSIQVATGRYDMSVESEITGNGADYRGFQSKSRSGRACQRWDSQDPHAHTYTAQAYPEAGLVENHCRNPSGGPYIWCFTEDVTMRWELCYPIGMMLSKVECPSGYMVQDATMRKVLFYSSVVFAGLAIAWATLVCCVLSRIALAIAITEFAATFVACNPVVLVVPIVQGLCGICITLLFVVSASFVVSQVPDDYSPKETFATYAEAYGTETVPGKCTDRVPTGFVWKDEGPLCTGHDPKCWRCGPPRFVLDYRFWYVFFCYLWTDGFLIAVGQCIIAGAVAIWFFGSAKASSKVRGSVRDPKARSNLMASIRTVFRYHLGSLALGSFIIAVVQLIRYLLKYYAQQARQLKNPVVEAVLRAVDFVLGCIERCVRFLTKNAYIQVAIRGTNFCTSAKNAFQLILKNMLRVGILVSLGSVVQAIGWLFVTICTLATGYFLLGLMHPEREIFAPMFVFFCVAHVVSQLYMSIYSLACDTSLQCLLVAEEERWDPSTLPSKFTKLVSTGWRAKTSPRKETE